MYSPTPDQLSQLRHLRSLPPAERLLWLAVVLPAAQPPLPLLYQLLHL